jgi:hypothetical protein
MSRGEDGYTANVATTSAVTLDSPAPPMTAPKKALVDELMTARRDRYKQGRMLKGSESCHVFPVQSSRKPLIKGGGRSVEDASTAPPKISLLEGIQVGEEEISEKLQGQSTGHLLLRLLALSYIVPLCDASEKGEPSELPKVAQPFVYPTLKFPHFCTGKLTRQGYSVQDSLSLMHGLLKEQTGIVEHIFKSKADQASETSASSFESTTLDVWLVPRLITAAAVLSMRCSRVETGTYETMADLRSSLVGLSVELLCHSFRSSNQGANVRLVLVECLKASLRSFSSIGRVAFTTSQTVPRVRRITSAGKHTAMGLTDYG